MRARRCQDGAAKTGGRAAPLGACLKVLSGPGGDAFLEPIALTTGELYRTRELTSDGRAGRFSPAGRFVAYETGLET